MAEGAAVFDAVTSGRDRAFVYEIEVDEKDVTPMPNMRSEKFYMFSTLPELPQSTEHLMNYAPSR